MLLCSSIINALIESCFEGVLCIQKSYKMFHLLKKKALISFMKTQLSKQDCMGIERKIFIKNGNHNISLNRILYFNHEFNAYLG